MTYLCVWGAPPPPVPDDRALRGGTAGALAPAWLRAHAWPDRILRGVALPEHVDVPQSRAPESEAPTARTACSAAGFVSSALRLRYVRLTFDPRAPGRRNRRRNRAVGHVGASSAAQTRRPAATGKHAALRRSASMSDLRLF